MVATVVHCSRLHIHWPSNTLLLRIMDINCTASENHPACENKLVFVRPPEWPWFHLDHIGILCCCPPTQQVCSQLCSSSDIRCCWIFTRIYRNAALSATARALCVHHHRTGIPPDFHGKNVCRLFTDTGHEMVARHIEIHRPQLSKTKRQRKNSIYSKTNEFLALFWKLL